LDKRNRQLAQATFSRSFRDYQNVMQASSATVSPRAQEKIVPAPPLAHSKKLRDPPQERLSARGAGGRVVAKSLFTPRRFEEASLPTKGPIMSAPPTVREMFSGNVEQVRAENIDTLAPNFVDSVMKSDGSLVASALGQRTTHSSFRVDPFKVTEIAGWTSSDKILQNDPYFAKPIQRTGNSCVKYDIISGRKKNFWY
jgi:hypothetical protein